MDFEYLMRRMNEERDRAEAADNDAARQAHLELAEQYRQRIADMRGDGGPNLQLVGG